jgi:hypothetical protein
VSVRSAGLIWVDLKLACRPPWLMNRIAGIEVRFQQR